MAWRPCCRRSAVHRWHGQPRKPQACRGCRSAGWRWSRRRTPWCWVGPPPATNPDRRDPRRSSPRCRASAANSGTGYRCRRRAAGWTRCDPRHTRGSKWRMSPRPARRKGTAPPRRPRARRCVARRHRWSGCRSGCRCCPESRARTARRHVRCHRRCRTWSGRSAGHGRWWPSRGSGRRESVSFQTTNARSDLRWSSELT